MAKKQTRRSISVSRTTYERLKAFCESNNISMSQYVETRVGDFLGGDATGTVDIIRPTLPRPAAPAPAKPASPAMPNPVRPGSSSSSASTSSTESRPAPQVVPMTSAAARFAVEPPPPVIKPKQEQPAPKPAEKRPDQIFTF
jgi:hypothetical protein